ncbi:hypothetical protein C1H46_003309 [Malus baccata]|uniref:Uncharacterized protein n=1 Tax=Malus baccata TaxID=106549 RepID=A0A540NJ60_MALBA|nr:hypothetical protein C1H46_003309 [Malus baccata]
MQRRSHSGVNGVARPLGSHGNNLRGPLELLVRPLKAAGATSWSCCIFLDFFWFSFGLAEEEDEDEDVLSLPFTPCDHTLFLFNFFS